MKFVIPVKGCVITNPFNAPASYPYAPTRKQLHEGIDLAGVGHIPIFAANTGTVLQVGYDARGYGNYVIIKHNARFYTWYGHMDKVYVGDNQPVTLTTELGTMGATGHATGQHLHFNVQDMLMGLNNYVVSKVVDPKPLLVSTLDILQETWYSTLLTYLGETKFNVRSVYNH